MAHFNLDNYETVEDRLARFWKDHEQGRILTSIHYYDESRILVRAEIYFDQNDQRPVASGYAEEIRGASPVNRTSHAENAETSAIGRGLANCGYAAKGSRPSREEMEKVARGSESIKVQPAKTVDLLKKFEDACTRSNLSAKDVATRAGIDLTKLTETDMPKLRDAFRSMQEQAKVAVPDEKPLTLSIEEVAESFGVKVNEPEVKNKIAPASSAQIGKVRGLMQGANISSRGDQADLASDIIHRRIEKLDGLKKGEADAVIKVLLGRQGR